MARVLQMIAVLAVATLAAAQLSKSKAAKKYDPEDVQTQPSLVTILQSPDATDAPPSLAVNLELPKEEAPAIPFYTPEPATLTILKAPSVTYFGNPTVEYNAPYPVPSQDLQVPSIEPWNPNNDPKFYYELPSVVTKQELPTGLHPKKYNKDVYEKQKPLANRPKQEISLVPISEEDYVSKQRKVNKVLLNLAKVQNQKLLAAEKVERLQGPRKAADSEGADGKEPQAAASGFSQGFDDEGAQQAISANSGYNHDLNSALAGGLHSAPEALHSASADLYSAPAPNKRLDFQMHGHDGPLSYKWGFDTGKGHNRQFRYEERDKHGYVKGHYGYYDKHGKLRMVHYDAHPHEGFRAEGNFGSH